MTRDKIKLEFSNLELIDDDWAMLEKLTEEEMRDFPTARGQIRMAILGMAFGHMMGMVEEMRPYYLTSKPAKNEKVNKAFAESVKWMLIATMEK